MGKSKQKQMVSYKKAKAKGKINPFKAQLPSDRDWSKFINNMRRCLRD